MTWLACLLLLAAPSAEDRVREADALRQEWARVEAFNTEELEQAPIRGWGTDALQEPLRRVQRALRDAIPRLDASALAAVAEAGYDAILDALKLKPLCTLAPGPEGATAGLPSRAGTGGRTRSGKPTVAHQGAEEGPSFRRGATLAPTVPARPLPSSAA